MKGNLLNDGNLRVVTKRKYYKVHSKPYADERKKTKEYEIHNMVLHLKNNKKVEAEWELRGEYNLEETKKLIQLAYTSNHNSKEIIDEFLNNIKEKASGQEIKELYYAVGWKHKRSNDGTPNKDKETREILEKHPEYRIKILNGIRHNYIYHPLIMEKFKPNKEDEEQQELEKICTEEFTDLETLKEKGITYEKLTQILERHKIETEKEFVPSLIAILKDEKGRGIELFNREHYIVTTKKWSEKIVPQYAKPAKEFSIGDITIDAETYKFPKLQPALPREAEYEMANKYLTVMNKIRQKEKNIGLSRKSLETAINIMNKEEYTSLTTTGGEFSKEKLEETIKEIKKLEKLERHYSSVFSWHNTRFISKVVKKCSRSRDNEELKELSQCGHLGLLEALRMYEPKENTTFLTYAVWRIRQEIYHGMMENHNVKIEPRIREAIRIIHNAEEKYLVRDGKTPTREDYTKITSLSKTDIGKALDATAFMNLTSLNEHISDDTELGDMLHDKNSQPKDEIMEYIDSKQRRNLIRKALESMKPIEAGILKRRNGIDCEKESLEKIGKFYDLSRESIRQIEKKATKKLKRKLQLRCLLKDNLNEINDF